jgi:hypothetical protein
MARNPKSTFSLLKHHSTGIKKKKRIQIWCWGYHPVEYWNFTERPAGHLGDGWFLSLSPGWKKFCSHISGPGSFPPSQV